MGQDPPETGLPKVLISKVLKLLLLKVLKEFIEAT